MDKNQQAERIQKITRTIALRATELSPEDRPAFIQEEIAKVREAFRQTYEADERLTASAMAFVDKMDEWIQALVMALEMDGGEHGSA
jgi:hypothetical protein